MLLMKKRKTSRKICIPLGIVIFLSCFIIPKANSQDKIHTDHHVHIFSSELLTKLKSNKFGFEQFKGPEYLYSNIDSIIKINGALNICLISTGYAFRQSFDNSKLEIQQQLKEQNFLSNAAFKYPKRIKPFYGINPLKPYAIQLVRRAHKDLNFAGIKLHFRASHIDFRKNEHVEALREIFTYTGQNKIPVILHFQNHKSDFGNSEVDYFFNYVLPGNLSQTIIFAHLGAGGWLNEKSHAISQSILTNLEHSVIKHDIKFEISGILSEQYRDFEKIADKTKLKMLRKIGFQRLLFGSDYPLIDAKSYFHSLKSRLKLTKKEKRSLLNQFLY